MLPDIAQPQPSSPAPISPEAGAGWLRTLGAVYERSGTAWTDNLWSIAKQVAAQRGGGEAEAREALKKLLFDGYLEMTSGFEGGVLTRKGLMLARQARR